MKPDPTKVTGMRHGSYDKLNDKGYVPEETVIVNGDIIIGKVSPIQPSGNNNKMYKDSSEVYKSHASGVIDKVYTGIYNNEGYEMMKCRVRSMRVPTIGDKFCTAEDTEALTIDGWKFVKDLTMDDKIATLEDNKLKYVKPIGIYNRDYDGKMYELNSTYVNFAVTIDHELYVRLRSKTVFEHKQAKDIIGKAVHYKVGGVETENKYQEKFIVPAYNNYPIKELNMDAWLAFFGMWLAEGWWEEIKSNSTFRITFSVNKERVRNALKKACDTLDFHIVENKDKWHINSIQLVKYLQQIHPTNKAVNKHLPSFVWSLNTEQSRILVNSMRLGDGTEDSKTACYYTSSKQLANDFQRLCIHAGWSGMVRVDRKAGHKTIFKEKKGPREVITKHDSLCININKNYLEPLVNPKAKSLTRNIESIYDYKGKVYCLEVPSHVFMMRYKGKISFSGQCSRHGQKGTIGLTMKASDLMFSSQGISPDIILNPNAIPSRMTIGQLVECLLGKVSALEGHDADGTPFNDINIEEIKNRLESLGFHRDGIEYMYNGMTGQRMKIMIFIGPTYYQRLKHLVEDKIHCLSYSSEVLTLEGWKNIFQLTMNDKIATLNNDNLLKYEEPINIMKYPDYEGKIYHIENEDINLTVTGNHRMYVKMNNNKYGFERADNIIGKTVKYKKNAKWDVDDYQFILADKKHNMKSLLVSLGTWYRYHDNDEYCSIMRITNKELYNYMKTLDESLPEWVFKLSCEQARILIDSLMSYNDECDIKSIKLANDIQRLCLHAGWAANISDNKIIILKENINPSVQRSERLETFRNEKCPVFCLQVKSEIFYVRQNGKTAWTGNSRSRGPRTNLTRQPPEGQIGLCLNRKILASPIY